MGIARQMGETSEYKIKMAAKNVAASRNVQIKFIDSDQGLVGAYLDF